MTGATPAPGQPARALVDLPSLGPRSQQMLVAAGITSMARLRELGAPRAYVLVRRREPRASLNLLWGLASALSGEPWQLIAREHRTSLLLAVEQVEREVEREVGRDPG